MSQHLNNVWLEENTQTKHLLNEWMGLYILKTNVQTQLSEREPSENKSYYKIANWSQAYLAFTISTVDNSLFIQLSFFFSFGWICNCCWFWAYNTNKINTGWKDTALTLKGLSIYFKTLHIYLSCLYFCNWKSKQYVRSISSESTKLILSSNA